MLTEPASGSLNMAVDETLMNVAARARECILRVYGWTRPTLSFGRNQSVAGRYDLARVRAAGVECVRRPTGGRSVLHHREVTYSVAAPEHALGAPRESYARINRILLHALESLGVFAAVAPAAGRAMAPGPNPCFDRPASGELVVLGRKLVGSAQWRDGKALLQHGSILVRDDQSRIRELVVGTTGGAAPPATLWEVLGREPSLSEVGAALRAAIVTLEDSEASPLGVEALPAAGLVQALARYSDESWTWRR